MIKKHKSKGEHLGHNLGHVNKTERKIGFPVKILGHNLGHVNKTERKIGFPVKINFFH